MSMIFQNPRAALNPIRAIGLQIADVPPTHRGYRRRRRAESAGAAAAVQIRDPERG